jgi:hypothetical protein
MCEDVGGSSVGIRLLLTADTQITIDVADDMVFVEHLETLGGPPRAVNRPIPKLHRSSGWSSSRSFVLASLLALHRMGMNPRLTSGHTAFRRSDTTLGEDRAAHRPPSCVLPGCESSRQRVRSLGHGWEHGPMVKIVAGVGPVRERDWVGVPDALPLKRRWSPRGSRPGK